MHNCLPPSLYLPTDCASSHSQFTIPFFRYRNTQYKRKSTAGIIMGRTGVTVSAMAALVLYTSVFALEEGVWVRMDISFRPRLSRFTVSQVLCIWPIDEFPMAVIYSNRRLMSIVLAIPYLQRSGHRIVLTNIHGQSIRRLYSALRPHNPIFLQCLREPVSM